MDKLKIYLESIIASYNKLRELEALTEIDELQFEVYQSIRKYIDEIENCNVKIKNEFELK